MKPKFAATMCFLMLLALSTLDFAFSQSLPSTSDSPNKQWRYVGGDTPKLVKVATSAAALEFSCELGGSYNSPPVWAPDSKRFAIPCAGGKGSSTSVYQLRDGKWEAGDALGNGDEIMNQAAGIIEAQAKKSGMPKKTFLHMNAWTVEPQRWTGASTLVVYAAMSEVAHRQNGEYAGVGYGTNLLFTLKFDEMGAWKITRTHQMSAEEVKQLDASKH